MKLNKIGTVREVEGGFAIEFFEKYRKGLTGIDGFSFLNILWWADRSAEMEYAGDYILEKPYKKGPEKIGIFATRSQIRPSPIGLTVIQVTGIDHENGVIYTPYMDAYSGTLVLDIKPYLPAANTIKRASVPEWCSHWPDSIEASGHFDWQSEFNF